MNGVWRSANRGVLITLLTLTAGLMVYLIALGTASARADNHDVTTDEATGLVTIAQEEQDECSQVREVASIGPTTGDVREPFEISERSFRVTYEVAFSVPETEFRSFDVEIVDEFGLVESDSTEADGTFSFLVPEGPGSFEIVTNVEPENGAEYTVIVEECAGTGGGTTEVTTAETTGGTVHVSEKVIIRTIPRKPLPPTGGLRPPSLSPVSSSPARVSSGLVSRFGAYSGEEGRRGGGDVQ